MEITKSCTIKIYHSHTTFSQTTFIHRRLFSQSQTLMSEISSNPSKIQTDPSMERLSLLNEMHFMQVTEHFLSFNYHTTHHHHTHNSPQQLACRGHHKFKISRITMRVAQINLIPPRFFYLLPLCGPDMATVRQRLVCV